MENRIKQLELNYDSLIEKIDYVDEYSRHVMNNTIVVLGIITAIATGVILIAAYFMIKQMINSKIENEVEQKVINIMINKSPIHYAKGKSIPDENNVIYLPEELEGINDLEPRTVIIMDVKSEVALFEQVGANFNPKLRINEKGVREIKLKDYFKENGEISWSLAWARKEY